MPETVSLNFDILELTISKDESILFSLLIPGVIRFNTSKEAFAQELINALNKRYTREGEYLEVLKLFPELQLKEKTLFIPLDKDKKGILYPDLLLEFQILYSNQSENKYIGFVPVLGIESFAETEAQLEKNLMENIRLEFARKKRLADVGLILSTMWFKEIKPLLQPVQPEFYSLNELAEIRTGEKKKILSGVAEFITTSDSSETFGLDYEKKQISKALQGKYRSILLIGPSGIGKTSLVYDIYHNKSKYGLSSEKFRETNASQLIRKLTDDGGWQQNLARLCQELRKENNILFIRNFADMFETGQYIGNTTSLAEYLRKYIERGEITIITECTPEEAARIDVLSPGYLSLFHSIHFEEAESKDIEDIIKRKIRLVAEKNNITINEDAIQEIIQLQQRYTPYSGFPGKTIRFLESAILNQKQSETVIDRKLALQYFCEETGLPDFMIDQSIPMDIKGIENFFQSNVFGQDTASDTIVNLLTSVKAALSRRGKPIASLLFVGPTGVGKTEMAKILAQFMFGSRQKMFRFDMSEYSSPDAVLGLTGSSFFSEGKLTSKIRQEPFSVVLFDELEKAHYSFFDLLLQILGEGRLTDSKGKITDFCSTIIIMTSNIGAKSYQKGTFGFVEKDIRDEAESHFMKEVQSFFRPELFNRLDQVIPFLPLDKLTVRNIVRREISRISERDGIKYRNTTFEISENALDYLCEQGYDAYYGARQMQRTLREELLIPLSHKLNSYISEKPLNSKIEVVEGKLQILVKPVKPGHTISTIFPEAEETLYYRRESQRLEEGEYFIKLLSEIDILEHRKRKLKDDFWKDTINSEKYTNYVRLKETFTGILKRIRDLETEAFIKKPTIENTDFKDSFNNWLKSYLEIKTGLYSLLTPKSDVCTIGLYGPEEYLFELYHTYQFLGAEKKYQASIKSVWLSNNQVLFTVTNEVMLKLKKEKVEESIIEALQIYLNKIFNTEEAFLDELKKMTLTKEQKALIIKYAGSQYIKTNKLTPERKNDRLLGLEIEFRGNTPYLYFQGENGTHAFKKNFISQELTKYWVQVSNCKLEEFTTPANIHRKNYYDDLKEQRVFAPGFLHDSYYKIKDQNCSNPRQKLKETLDKRLSNFLTYVLEYGE